MGFLSQIKNISTRWSKSQGVEVEYIPKGRPNPQTIKTTGFPAAAITADQQTDRIAKGQTVNLMNLAVVPLDLPLMAGRGDISSVIVFAAEHNSLSNIIAMFITVIVFGLVSFGLFRMASIIYKILGKTGINVITRLMGLLMLSIGIEVIAAGVKGLFPQLFS